VRAARAPAALVVAALFAAGCGVRIEAPPPDLPTPDAAEVARQGAAQRAEALAADAGAAAEGAGGDRAVLGRVADDARVHVEALGGVWTPPAWASPSPGTPSPRASSPAASSSTPSSPPPSAADVLAELSAAAAATCTDAVAVEPGDLATLLASICLAEAGASADLAAAAALPPPAAPAALATVGDADAPGLPDGLLGALGPAEGTAALGRALDAAGFALEVAGARSASGARDAVARLAEDHRIDARAVLQAAGLLGGAEDPRRAAYDLPDAAGGGEDPSAAVASVEEDVLAAWTSVLGELAGAARGQALTEMAAAAGRARAWGAAPAPLPGLESP
jgi:hypothetical protein